MFFKSLFFIRYARATYYLPVCLSVYLSVAILVGFLLGCSRESTPAVEPPNVAFEASQCMNSAFDNIEKYFKGLASREETAAIWSCFSGILHDFRNYARGQNANGYRPEELREFIERYFLDHHPPRPGQVHLISDQLLVDMMQVKKLFLSGHTELLTKPDIDETIKLLAEMSEASQRFLPHIRYFYKKNKSLKPSLEDIQLIEGELEKALQPLAQRLVANNAVYSLKSMQSLLRELRLFFVWIHPDSKFSDVSRFVPIFGHLKHVLFNTSTDAVVSFDFAKAPNLIAKVASQYFRLRFYIQDDSLYNLEEIGVVQDFLFEITALLRQGVLLRDTQAISTQSLVGLIEEFGHADMLPFGLKADDVGRMAGRFVDYIFNQQQRFAVEGLSLEKINFLDEQISNWLYAQRFILGAPLEVNEAVLELRSVMASPWSMSLDQLGRILMSGEAGEANIKAATRLNWLRVLARFITNAYAEDANRRTFNAQLKLEELETVFLDLRPILVGLGFVKSNDFTFHEGLFREGNLFMPRSDGDKFLSYTEVIEYIHFVFAGFKAGEYFLSQLPAECFLNNDLISEHCFQSHIFNRADDILSHLPHYYAFTRKLTEAEWRFDIDQIHSAARKDTKAGEPLERIDVYRSFVFLQYVEAVILRFDTDKNALIELQEGLVAMPHFLETLASLMEQDTSDPYQREFTQGAFTYMLRYTEPPLLDGKYLSQLQFLNWRNHPEKWSFSVGRSSMLQILAKLNELSRQ